MTFARAGHPYPVLVREGEGPVQLENRGGLLGVFAESGFEEKSVQLQKGDKLFVYSDGCEAIVGNTDENGKFIFSEDFVSAAEYDVEDMVGRFNELVKVYKPGPGENDDITVVALQILLFQSLRIRRVKNPFAQYKTAILFLLNPLKRL